MNKKQKILLVLIGICMLIVIGVVAFQIFMPKPEIKADDIEVSQRTQEESPADVDNKSKEFVNIYFIGKNEHNEEVYKAVKREYSKDVDGSKVKFAVYALISGPKIEEQKKGIYSEIPRDAEVISIKESSNYIIVNLNSAFVNGGGADSLYKRMYQLIKTVKLNTLLPVYLYIDGHKAEVLGGEGIMITQPLSNSSLEN
jgi:spore germination protein GerM